MKLRDYQEVAVQSVLREWLTKTSTLLVLPTGAGKTIVASELMRRVSPRRTMFVCHKGELIWQTRDKVSRLTGMECEVEMAELAASTNLFCQSPVVLATVQTLISGSGRKRLHRFSPNEFGVLIVDEGHRGVSPSFKMVSNHFRQNPNLKVLYLTATPDRHDQKALSQISDSVAMDYEILDAINDGWLVPVEQQMVHIQDYDLSNVSTTAGDLNGPELARVMEMEKVLHGVAHSTIQIAGSKQTIVFAASVQQAETLCNIFNRHRPGMSAWISGKTPKQNRNLILQDFRSQKVQVVCNVAVLTEGFDSPEVEVIVMARPTKSRALYAQMAGRSLRPLAGVVDGVGLAADRRLAIDLSQKKKCLIVDFVGNSGRHKLMSTANILGGNVSDEAIALAAKKAREKGVPVNMAKELQESEEEIRKRIEDARLREESRRSKLIIKATYKSHPINPFDALDIRPVMDLPMNDGRILSNGQRKILLQAGLNPDQYKYTEGSQLAKTILMRWKNKMSSVGQCRILKRAGYEHPEKMKSAEASSLIEKVKLNNWKKL